MNTAIKHYSSTLPFPFSRAVKVGEFLFLSGQVSMANDGTPMYGDIRTQTQVVMDTISETLRTLGAALEDVFKVTVWLSDMQHFSDFNSVYVDYFKNGFPARSVVSAKLAFGLDVEVEVQAVAPAES